jgi:hypothetical protein
MSRHGYSRDGRIHHTEAKLERIRSGVTPEHVSSDERKHFRMPARRKKGQLSGPACTRHRPTTPEALETSRPSESLDTLKEIRYEVGLDDPLALGTLKHVAQRPEILPLRCRTQTSGAPPRGARHAHHLRPKMLSVRGNAFPSDLAHVANAPVAEEPCGMEEASALKIDLTPGRSAATYWVLLAGKMIAGKRRDGGRHRHCGRGGFLLRLAVLA